MGNYIVHKRRKIRHPEPDQFRESASRGPTPLSAYLRGDARRKARRGAPPGGKNGARPRTPGAAAKHSGRLDLWPPAYGRPRGGDRHYFSDGGLAHAKRLDQAPSERRAEPALGRRHQISRTKMISLSFSTTRQSRRKSTRFIS